MEKIDQCFVCKEWFLEEVLQLIDVKDYGAHHVQKLVCSGCVRRIKTRSAGKTEPEYLCEHDGA